MGHNGGDRCRCCPLEVILQAGCRWRSTLGEVEISARWISFAGDRRCLYSVRWRSALFGLDERKRMEGRRGRENCVWVLGESDEKKKKKEKSGCIHRYGAQVVGSIKSRNI